MNNLYDITQKTFLFKLGWSNQRENLLINSGINIFTSKKIPETKEKPNKFILKLRKHIKGLFVDKIKQIGVERILKITFKGADRSKEEFTFFLYLEFYAKGNIILTDAHDITLACQRIHIYDEENKVE